MSEAAADGGGGRWRHQPEAVAAVARALAGGGRCTVVSACGTGKTRVGAMAAATLAPAGRVLVMVPTLELTAQLLGAFAAHGGPLGRAVAVCSDAEVAGAAELGAGGGGLAVATSAARLAGLAAGDGRVTVTCTYASLPVLAAAHGRHGLPAWDLAVVDEAHRTAGRAGSAWSAIHDDVVVPAARRLYMTATPRIMAGAGDDLAVSMDDEKVYGPVVFELGAAEAIRRGLLADYEVLAVVVTDDHVRDLAGADDRLVVAGGTPVSPRVLAAQLAVLRAAAGHGVRRAITYHSRVAAARAWAETLPRAWELLGPAERPAAVRAGAVWGGQRPAARRAVLAGLLAGPDGTGGPGGELRVVCNARVLTEGVDAPAVDAVVLADPRDSVIDTVQAVGRALRTGGQPGKIARIIVPVILGPGEDPEAALQGSAWAPAWQVLRALRACDERLAGVMDAARARQGRARVPGAQAPEDDGGAGEDGGPGRWLKVTGIPVPPGFAAAICLRAVRAASPGWEEYWGAAAAYRAARGHLDVPVGYQAGGLALGEWLRAQRRNRARLPAARAARLEEIGMSWDAPGDRAWAAGTAAAAAFAAGHGGRLRDIPATWARDGVRLRAWLTNQRTAHRDGTLDPARKASLDAIDPGWHLDAGALWELHCEQARAHAAAHGSLLPGPGQPGPDGLDLAAWLDRQRRARRAGELDAARQARLEAIGMHWTLLDAGWSHGLAAAAAHAREHGSLDVPTGHVTPAGFGLGQWLATRRKQAAAGRLPAARRAALDALDPAWHAARSYQARWQERYEQAAAYAAAHGHLPRRGNGIASPDPDGPDFRPWLRQQRQDARRGLLAPGRAAALAALDPAWRGDPPAPPPGAPERGTG